MILSSHDIQLLPESEKVSYSADIDKEHVITIQELIDGYNLDKLVMLNRIAKVFLSKATAHRYIDNLLQGLKEMQDNNVAHRDIKPANIMLLKGVLKFVDFGLGCFTKNCSGRKGTPFYLPPETHRFEKQDWFKGDIFSLGLTMLKIISGEHVYDRVENIERSAYDIDAQARMFEEVVQRALERCGYLEYKELILGMINPIQEKRISLDEAIHLFSKVSTP